MKALLDLLPAVAFLTALFLKDIYAATVVLMISMVLLAAFHWIKDRRPHKLHTLGAIAVVVLGSLTLFLHDSTFVKYKTSVVNTVIALALLLSHFIGDKVLLQRIPQQAIQLPNEVWRKVNLAWAGFFFAVALLNLYVMHHFNDRVWGLFKTFGISALMFVFMLAHLPFLGRYLEPEDSGSK